MERVDLSAVAEVSDAAFEGSEGRSLEIESESSYFVGWDGGGLKRFEGFEDCTSAADIFVYFDVYWGVEVEERRYVVNGEAIGQSTHLDC